MVKGLVTAHEVRLGIQKLDKLETSPWLARQMMRYIDKSTTSVSLLSKWIAMDQVLAARVLKLANAPNYGYSGQIATLNLAIVIIGFDALRNLLMGISVIDQFAETAFGKDDPLDRHNLQVAAGARYLAKLAGYPVTGEAFVAGLLHDIGHRVLLQEYPDQFKQAVHLSKIKKIPYHLAEKELLGFDHTEVGAWLAQAWNFPPALITAIQFHHSPDSVERNDLLYLTHLADLICYSIEDDDITLDGQLQQELETEILKKLKSYFLINSHPLGYFQKNFRNEGKKVTVDLRQMVTAGVKI